MLELDQIARISGSGYSSLHLRGYVLGNLLVSIWDRKQSGKESIRIRQLAFREALSVWIFHPNLASVLYVAFEFLLKAPGCSASEALSVVNSLSEGLDGEILVANALLEISFGSDNSQSQISSEQAAVRLLKEADSFLTKETVNIDQDQKHHFAGSILHTLETHTVRSFGSFPFRLS